MYGPGFRLQVTILARQPQSGGWVIERPALLRAGLRWAEGGPGISYLFSLTTIYCLVYIQCMTNQEFKSWRTRWGFSQGKLAKALGVRSMTVARWEWGTIRIPALLPLALEALENRIKEGKLNGLHQ